MAASPYNLNCVGNEGGALEYLNKCQFPPGLQNFFLESLKSTPIRYIVCDDSGSMNEHDGSIYNFPKQDKAYKYSSKPTVSNCSRWNELKETIDFHVNLSYYGQIATNIRFLNRGSHYRIGFPDTIHSDGETLNTVKDLFNTDPSGGTPLCTTIQDIALEISQIAPFLKNNNHKVALIIYTDGEPSDGNFKSTIDILKNLPVFVVIRLCTDLSSVQSYWAEVEKNVELNLDIIDDYKNEALEIYNVNNFLNYCYPIHKIREYGITDRIFDHLDEGSLTLDQVKKYVSYFLSPEDFAKIPDITNPKQFFAALNEFAPKFQFFDPVKGKLAPFLHVSALKRKHKTSCVIN